MSKSLEFAAYLQGMLNGSLEQRWAKAPDLTRAQAQELIAKAQVLVEQIAQERQGQGQGQGNVALWAISQTLSDKLRREIGGLNLGCEERWEKHKMALVLRELAERQANLCPSLA